jgi:DNA-binding PadR family transcriptional regulator
MDIHTPILGMLNWKPASGYDLKRVFSDSEIFYWSGNNNQIYKSLLELQKAGLVSYQVQPQDSLPAKKIYSITEAGRQELRRRLLDEPEVPELHKSFLIQMAWAENLSDQEILVLLEKYAGEIADRLHLYQVQGGRPGNTPARSAREQYIWKRIRENLVATYQAELDWALETLAALRQGKY